MQYLGQVQFLLATDLCVLYIYTIHIYINGNFSDREGHKKMHVHYQRAKPCVTCTVQ